MADHQFAGRGQRESVWQTEPGKNLTFSVFLKPEFISIEKHFDLNMLISVALSNALTKYLPLDLTVKWPNDIYHKDLKIGGMLIENAIIGNKIKHSIIGIGLNVNQRIFDEQLQQRASSISQILQQDVNLTVLLIEICTQIEQLYLKLKKGNSTFLKELYVNRLYRLHKLAKYSRNGEVFDGVIEGINDMGLLRIKPLDAELMEVDLKEIVFL